MPNITAPQISFPTAAGNSQAAGTPADQYGFLGVSEIAAKYANLVKSGKVQSAYATVTTPAAFSTTTGIGGPLLWNHPGSKIDLHLLAMSVAVATANTVAGSLGICGASGQNGAPSSTTAIDASGCTFIGGPSSSANAYRIGTVSVASTIFVPIFEAGTGAVTVVDASPAVFDLGGSFICPPGSWIAIAGSAALTTGVFQIGLIWAELPN